MHALLEIVMLRHLSQSERQACHATTSSRVLPQIHITGNLCTWRTVHLRLQLWQLLKQIDLLRGLGCGSVEAMGVSAAIQPNNLPTG